MTRKSLQNLECAVANTVETIGDAWTILVLRDAFLGVRRFDDFVSSLGVARNTLTDRLEKLVAAGMMQTRPYQDNPVRLEYRLTDKGRDLFDVLMTLWSFGERWNPPLREDHQRVIHADCGSEALAVTHCASCGGRLSRSSVTVEPVLPVVASRLAASTEREAHTMNQDASS